MNARRILLLLLLAAISPAQAAIDIDSGDYLSWSSAPVTSAPLTLYCRFSADSAAAVAHYVAIREGTNLNDGGFSIGHNSSGQFRAMAVENNGFSIATLASPTIATSTWHHAFGVFDSTTSRFAILDANNQQDTSSRTPAGLNNLIVGQTNSLSLFGQVAEVCIWNVALTGDERTAIVNGARPCAVRPGAVVHYVSGIATTTAEIGGAPTVTGTPTIVTHPSVVYVTRHPQHPMNGGFSND